MARNYKQGYFIPKNPNKYRGDHTKIIFRSSWEKKFMDYCDRNSNVLQWSSEEVIVPYFYDVDQKMHRYFPDFVIQTKNLDETITTTMIEVKPKAQVAKPRIKKITPKNQDQVFTYVKNQNKWKAAEAYCNQRNWKFQILTEEDLKV